MEIDSSSEVRRSRFSLLTIGAGVLLASLVIATAAFQLTNWQYPSDANGIECAFLQMIVRLNTHMPLYSEVERADSSIYHPGGAVLTWAILRPFRLSSSLLAARVMQTIFVGIACASLSFLCWLELKAKLGRVQISEAIVAISFTLLLHISLATFGFCSPNSGLEMCWAMALLLGWRIARQGTDRGTLIAWSLVCYAMFLMKQPGLCYSLALSGGICTALQGNRSRLALLAATLMGLGCSFGTLYFLCGRSYLDWCFVVPGQQPVGVEFLARSDGMGGSIEILALATTVICLWIGSRDSVSRLSEGRQYRYLLTSSALAGLCGMLFSSKVGAGPAHLLPMLDATLILAAPAVIITLRQVLATPWRQALALKFEQRAMLCSVLSLALCFQASGVFAKYYTYWKFQARRQQEMSEIIALGRGKERREKVLYMAHGYGSALGKAKIVPNENALWDLTQAKRSDCIQQMKGIIAQCQYDVIVIQSCIAAGNPEFAKVLTDNYLLQPGFAYTQIYVRPQIADQITSRLQRKLD